MPAMLIGMGPNRIEIPAMVFESLDAGIAFVSAHLGKQPDQLTENSASWNVYDIRESWNDHATEMDEYGDPKGVFYTSYSDGCGDCYRMYLVEVAYATPMVAWDLD